MQRWISFWHFLKKYLIHFYFVYVRLGAHIRGQRVSLWNWFSSSVLVWIPGTELWSSGLCGKCLSVLSLYYSISVRQVIRYCSLSYECVFLVYSQVRIAGVCLAYF